MIHESTKKQDKQNIDRGWAMHKASKTKALANKKKDSKLHHRINLRPETGKKEPHLWNLMRKQTAKTHTEHKVEGGSILRPKK